MTSSSSYQQSIASPASSTQKDGEASRAFNSHLSMSSTDADKPTNEYVLNVAFFSFLGFTLVQTGFAILAKSQAMLADSEAMFVDALTYLFNLLAERLKHRPYSEKDLQLPSHVRHHRRKLMRLYLELIPPLISVSTLMAVTIVTLRDSMRTLLGGAAVAQPDITIMLIFSAANLLLDFVNVTCFARADQAIGLMHAQSGDTVDHHNYQSQRSSSAVSEQAPLLGGDNTHTQKTNNGEESDEESEDSEGINLNMCSAWTHVCADTLRSVAVLIAAGIAFVWDELTPNVADAVAAVIVSFIIMFSLLPLFQGLYFTTYDIWVLSRTTPTARHGLTIVV